MIVFATISIWRAKKALMIVSFVDLSSTPRMNMVRTELWHLGVYRRGKLVNAYWQ